MLNAPVVDVSNFGLHFAKLHIKVHRVLKSQASLLPERSPSFTVYISGMM